MIPKQTMEKFKLRHSAYGVERRRNMSKMILEHGTPFPKGVELKDIDQTFKEWVENSLDVSYNGKKLPTFRMFSSQRLNEYSQTWQHLDETGNLLLNFKTINRENNPKQGQNQGNNFNIPGNRDYPMFIVPVLQENGEEAYDMYSMKQPFCVDLEYAVTIVTNKYEVLNDMNQRVHFEFKAINCYIAPNGHFMPMTLEDVSDESEYSLDDRKYYSQSYKIKVKAYIIRKEDFTVTKLPSRAIMRLLGVTDKKKPKIQIGEEDYIADDCCLREEQDPYYNKLLTVIVDFPSCTDEAKFIIDSDMIIRKFETSNVYDFVISVNGEFQFLDKDIHIYDGDEIFIELTRDKLTKDSTIVIQGFDPNVILDSRYNPESSLDEDISEEELYYNAKGEV